MNTTAYCLQRRHETFPPNHRTSLTQEQQQTRPLPHRHKATMRTPTPVFITALAALQPALAAPTVDSTIPSALLPGKRDIFGGQIEFFSRTDCNNGCYPSCFNGEAADGDRFVDDQRTGIWVSVTGQPLCWDVPEDTHSVGLCVDDGHGYNGTNVSCEQNKINYENNEYDGVRGVALKSGEDDMGRGECNALGESLPDWVRSVSYNW